MGPFDDYQDEMDELRPEQIEAILSGRLLEVSEVEDLSALVAEIRSSLLEDPSTELADRHLQAMAAAAPAGRSRPSPTSVTRRRYGPMGILSRRRLSTVALAATLLLGGGIAAALTLPDQADDRAREVVPDQAPPQDVPPDEEGTDPGAPEGEDFPLPGASEHGQNVSTVARDPSLQGCEHGQAVAEVASQNSAEHRQDSAEKTDPCEQAEDEPEPTPEPSPTPEPTPAPQGGGSGSGSGGPGGGGGGGSGGSGVGGGGGSGSGGPGGGGGSGSGGSDFGPDNHPGPPEDVP